MRRLIECSESAVPLGCGREFGWIDVERLPGSPAAIRLKMPDSIEHYRY